MAMVSLSTYLADFGTRVLIGAILSVNGGLDKHPQIQHVASVREFFCGVSSAHIA